ncbi:MAG TPA: DivIVA domain-containing protein [Acidimicrobiales bacterium]
MELTPQTLHAVEFREARRGGYNTRDVDDFLERVAEGVALLHDRLRDAMARAESAESRLAEVQRQLVELQRRPPAAPEASETDDTLRRTLVLAQRTADATIKEAKDEAARLLSEAREEAARIRSEIEAEARRGTEGARLQAEAELEHLLESRDALKGDLDALGEQIDRQREQIRAGIAELERLLENPNALNAVEPPRLSEVEVPAPASASSAPPAATPGQGNGPAAPAPGAPASAGAPGSPASSPGPAPAAAQMPSRPRVEVPVPAGPGRPALPQRNAPAASAAPAGGATGNEAASGNGSGGVDGPHFQLGAQVAALQEAPVPSRPKPESANGPQGAPFAPFGGPGGEGSPAPAAGQTPWPSQLRTSVTPDEAAAGPNGLPPQPAGGGPGGPGSNGPAVNGTIEGIGIEPGSRPSEWGKRVFDQADDTDPHARFGRR